MLGTCTISVRWSVVHSGKQSAMRLSSVMHVGWRLMALHSIRTHCCTYFVEHARFQRVAKFAVACESRIPWRVSLTVVADARVACKVRIAWVSTCVSNSEEHIMAKWCFVKWHIEVLPSGQALSVQGVPSWHLQWCYNVCVRIAHAILTRSLPFTFSSLVVDLPRVT